MGDISEQVRERLVVPAQETADLLDDLARETERSIDSAYDIARALPYLIAESDSVANAGRRDLTRTANELSDDARSELGFKDRRRAKQLASLLARERTVPEFNTVMAGITPGEPLRSVMGLKYVALMGETAAEKLTVPEMDRKTRQAMISTGMGNGDVQILQRTLLNPRFIRQLSSASTGFFTGQVREHGKGYNLISSSVYTKNPLENYPLSLRSELMITASKYWILGRLAGNIYLPTRKMAELELLPFRQREVFVDAAEEIRDIRSQQFFKKFSEYRDTYAYANANTNAAADDDYANDEPEAYDEYDEADDRLEEIILSVDDIPSRRALLSMDRDIIDRVITDIAIMRAANPMITDRKIYLTFRQQLESQGYAPSEPESQELGETVTVIGLLLGGDVSKSAQLPVF